MYDEKEFGVNPEDGSTNNAEHEDKPNTIETPGEYVEEEVQIKETVTEDVEPEYQNDYVDEYQNDDMNNQNYGYYGNGEFQNNNNYNDYYNNQNGNKKNKGSIVAVIVAIVLIVAMVVGGTVFVTQYIIDNYKNSDNSIEDKKDNGGEGATEDESDREYPSIESTENTTNADVSVSESGILITDVSQMVDNVMPSIVAITSKTKVEYYSNDWFSGGGFGFGYDDFYGGDTNEYEEVGAGSGIIVKQTDTELLIVTNNHVIEGADSLEVQFANGVSANCVMKGTDQAADLAIVAIDLASIDDDTMAAIKTAKLGSSDDIRVGEGVVAIGNALGYGQSVTTGVISAKDRVIAVDNNEMTVLQTDAAINGGNSGGALLNSKGEVIGINVAKYSSSDYSGSASIEGMGFAIPVSQAVEIIEQLMSQETRTKVDEDEKGSLGIKGITVDTSTSEAYFIPEGIYISEVIEGGGAEKAGLQATDVIIKFEGQNMKEITALVEKLEYYKAGETVTLTIKRSISRTEYEEMDVEVTLGKAQTEETTKSILR